MFFALSKLLDVLLSPLWWAILLGLLGVRWRGKEPGRARKWLARAGVALLLLFSTNQIAGLLGSSLEAHAVPTARRTGAPYDAVILLGGMVDEYAMRSPTDDPALNDNVERLHETLRMLRDGRARFALISAGSMAPSPSRPVEARVLRALLLSWGIEEQRIVLDDRSRNTRENAVESARIARERGWSRLVAVTSAAHARRARGCFRAVQLDPDWSFVDRRAPARPTLWALDGWIPRAKSLAMSETSLREMAGWWIYRARGYARP